MSNQTASSMATQPRPVARLAAGVLLLCSTVSAGGQSSNSDTGPNGDFVRLWDELTPTLEQALQHEDRHDSLPADAWFGPDQTSNQITINQLLDQAVTVLSTPSGKDYRTEIRRLESDISNSRRQIATLRQQRVTAPESALWGQSSADIDDEIKALQSRIDSNRQSIEALKQQFGAELRSLGLAISDDQLEFLLSTVIGDDIIALGVAFDSVKAVTEQLETLLVASGEDLQAARRYYGMYALLLSSLERLHDRLLGEVRRYLNELDGIEQRTGQLLERSRTLAKDNARHRQTLAANIEAQQLTLKTAQLYRDYLLAQAQDVATSRQRLAQDLAVAQNTYETVKLSGELVRMVHAGQHLLESLFTRETPAMFTFQNLEMQREFEKLTLKLRESAND